MTSPVLVDLLPGPPASARRAAPPVAASAVTTVQDLDVIVESAECSCDAGDDNPHLPTRSHQLRSGPGMLAPGPERCPARR